MPSQHLRPTSSSDDGPPIQSWRQLIHVNLPAGVFTDTHGYKDGNVINKDKHLLPEVEGDLESAGVEGSPESDNIWMRPPLKRFKINNTYLKVEMTHGHGNQLPVEVEFKVRKKDKDEAYENKSKIYGSEPYRLASPDYKDAILVAHHAQPALDVYIHY